MIETHLRHAATALLECAIRIAPPDVREWGHAVRAEMSYVEGRWAATLWAVGGAGVMAKEALAALLVPSLRGRGTVPDGGLFAKDASFRKAALVAGAGCTLAALLFFAAPPFRQAFEVAMKPWSVLIQIASKNFQPGLEALAQRAEARHDPEGMAFCAMRLREGRESARLAEEAVGLDPNLIWVYAVVGLRHPELPEVRQWMQRLAQRDPQNAFIPLITEESLVRTGFRSDSPWGSRNSEQESAWRKAMAAAFRSADFDDYLDRIPVLNRRVISRYRFYDPYEIESVVEYNLPGGSSGGSERFANLLLESGEELEAHGDRKAARDKYWAVARFGQLIDAHGHMTSEHDAGTSLQAMAYRRLQASFEKAPDRREAELFGYLAAKFDAIKGEGAPSPRESAFGYEVARRNAAVVGISGLMILFFSGLVAAGALVLMVGSRRGARPVSRRATPVATWVILTSAVGLLFSAVTLYLTYRPYWYILQAAILNGGSSQTSDLRLFLGATQKGPGVSPRVWMDALLYAGSPSFLFYFWTGITLFSVIGLVLILSRHLLGGPPPGGLQHSPRVP